MLFLAYFRHKDTTNVREMEIVQKKNLCQIYVLLFVISIKKESQQRMV